MNATVERPVSQKKDIDNVIEQLRRKIDHIGAAPAWNASPCGKATVAPAARSGASREFLHGVLPGPQWLMECTQGVGLPRAMVTSVADCAAVHADLLATVTASGACAAIVGYPQLALAAVDAAGGDLSRLVVVPDPQPHATAVVGTLIQGLDMVLYRVSEHISATGVRLLNTRVHKSHCALAITGQKWPSPQLTIEAQMTGVVGLGRGAGRIRGLEISGRVWGKTRPPRSFHTVLGTEADSYHTPGNEIPGRHETDVQSSTALQAVAR